MDFFSTITDVHPSLIDSTDVQSKSISNDTLARLATTVLALKEDKKQRLHKVDEVAVPGALALDLIEQAEVEVERLDQLKASRMKEIAFRKQTELEEIYARAHVEIDPEAAREKIMTLIDSGK
ncbi:hypothetical protein OIU78_018118 [Salix suchowensis]|nr:hypothetical protein OIU78_018118 [Salix suchowensis]